MPRERQTGGIGKAYPEPSEASSQPTGVEGELAIEGDHLDSDAGYARS